MEGSNARTNDDTNTRKRSSNENQKKQEQNISSPSLYRPTNIVIDANTTTNHANTNTATSSSSSGVVLVVKFTEVVIRPLIIDSLTYLDPESLRQVCLVSQEFHDMVHTHPGLQQRMFAVFQLHIPNDSRAVTGLRLEIVCARLRRRRRSLLHRYRTMKITNVQKFWTFIMTADMLETILGDLRFEGIVSLDMSLPNKQAGNEWTFLRTVFIIMTKILPNLRELDLSNATVTREHLEEFLAQNPRLEKITWHNGSIQLKSGISLCGRDMKSAETLREIYMDNTTFMSNISSRFKDLEDNRHSNIFLFYRCSKHLVHVSIRNAKQCKTYSNTPRELPQNALIKFIRNAPPTLKSFRSDLTQQNIDMLLQSDDGPRFSEIEFLN